jgi:hypothetical protein
MANYCRAGIKSLRGTLPIRLLNTGKHNMLLPLFVVQTCTETRTLCLRTTATGTDSPRFGTTSPRSNTEETIRRAAGSAAFFSPRRRGESANQSATVRSTMCASQCFGSDSLNLDPDLGILRIRIQFGSRSRPRFKKKNSIIFKLKFCKSKLSSMSSSSLEKGRSCSRANLPAPKN